MILLTREERRVVMFLFFSLWCAAVAKGLMKVSPQARACLDDETLAWMFPKVDLNTADAATLATLPFIGPRLAERMVRYRTIHGGFRDPSELRDIYGISDRVFNMIRYRVVVRDETE